MKNEIDLVEFKNAVDWHIDHELENHIEESALKAYNNALTAIDILTKTNILYKGHLPKLVDTYYEGVALVYPDAERMTIPITCAVDGKYFVLCNVNNFEKNDEELNINLSADEKTIRETLNKDALEKIFSSKLKDFNIKDQSISQQKRAAYEAANKALLSAMSPSNGFHANEGTIMYLQNEVNRTLKEYSVAFEKEQAQQQQHTQSMKVSIKVFSSDPHSFEGILDSFKKSLDGLRDKPNLKNILLSLDIDDISIFKDETISIDDLHIDKSERNMFTSMEFLDLSKEILEHHDIEESQKKLDILENIQNILGGQEEVINISMGSL